MILYEKDRWQIRTIGPDLDKAIKEPELVYLFHNCGKLGPHVTHHLNGSCRCAGCGYVAAEDLISLFRILRGWVEEAP